MVKIFYRNNGNAIPIDECVKLEKFQVFFRIIDKIASEKFDEDLILNYVNVGHLKEEILMDTNVKEIYIHDQIRLD